MSTIPISVTETQFDEHIRPYLRVAKRGYECKIPLHKVFNYILYQLHTGCQWYRLPIDPDRSDPDKKEISWYAIYYHFRKWSRDGSLQQVWQASIMTISAELNLSELNLDGTHAIAKKGGEAVAYQGRKKAKTTNVLPVTDGKGFIVASTGLLAGNHNDAYNLKLPLQEIFKSMKRLSLDFQAAFFIDFCNCRINQPLSEGIKPWIFSICSKYDAQFFQSDVPSACVLPSIQMFKKMPC